METERWLTTVRVPYGVFIVEVTSKKEILSIRPLLGTISELNKSNAVEKAPSELIEPIITALTKLSGIPAGYQAILPVYHWAPDFWQALQEVPRGKTITYSALATRLGLPTSYSRAIGNALGSNPILGLIPCHRVISSGGAIGGFRWGLTLKRQLLAYENNLNSRDEFVRRTTNALQPNE